MDFSAVQDSNQILTKLARRVENECGIKNGDFFVLVALMLIDNKTWTFDKSWLTRVYQALDIIEHNDEVKKLLQKEEVENTAQDN